MACRSVFALLILVIQIYHSFGVTVTTPVGDIIGYPDQLNVSTGATTLIKFQGIPYAESTAGVNRYRKPVPKASFTTPFNASQDGPSCVQAMEGSEDCLNLNVYVPGTTIQSENSLAVMVWIHGGGFVSGSTRFYHANVISARNDIIVVTLNYRLGEFGFLATGTTESPGNYGLWDQRLAIQWVHANIGSFGGNPNKVTIFGESAGAGSVMLQALYPGNTGLFQRVIAESGTPFNLFAFSPKPNAGQILNVSGCDNVECLRGKTAMELQAAINKNGINSFSPTLDNEFLHESPKDIIEKNNTVSAPARAFFSSLDIMTGVNSMEGALALMSVWRDRLHINDTEVFPVTSAQWDHVVIPTYVQSIFGALNLPKATLQRLGASISSEYLKPADRSDPLRVRDQLLTLASDLSFFLPVVETVKDHARLAAGTDIATYLYVFSEKPTFRAPITPSWVQGPSHTEEVQYVFGRPLVQTGVRAGEKILSTFVMSFWTNFAKSGNPNSATDRTPTSYAAWPRYDLTSQMFLDISSKMSMSSRQSQFKPSMWTFWTQTVPSIIKSGGGSIDPALIG